MVIFWYQMWHTYSCFNVLIFQYQRWQTFTGFVNSFKCPGVLNSQLLLFSYSSRNLNCMIYGFCKEVLKLTLKVCTVIYVYSFFCQIFDIIFLSNKGNCFQRVDLFSLNSSDFFFVTSWSSSSFKIYKTPWLHDLPINSKYISCLTNPFVIGCK